MIANVFRRHLGVVTSSAAVLTTLGTGGVMCSPIGIAIGSTVIVATGYAVAVATSLAAGVTTGSLTVVDVFIFFHTISFFLRGGVIVFCDKGGFALVWDWDLVRLYFLLVLRSGDIFSD